MLYMLYCLDKPDSLELRMANREAHLEYMGSSPIKIQSAGPLLDEQDESMCGSLLILEADNIDQVRELNRNDPYQKAGLFSSVVIRRFKKTVGN